MAEAIVNTNPHDRHPMLEQLSQLWRNKTAVIGLVIIIIFILTAIFAPLLSPHDPLETALYDQLKPPVWHYTGTTKNILGTDELGRDTLSRIIYGARVSLLVAVFSVGLAFVFGTLLGSVAGYYKGPVDSVIMRIMDMILAFPYLLLAIVVVAYLGPSLQNAMMAIAITYIPRFARIVRGSVLEGPLHRRQGSADHFSGHFTQLHGAADCSDHTEHGFGHIRCGGIELFGSRGTTTHSGMGCDDRPQPVTDFTRVLGDDLSGDCHFTGRAGIQSAR